jgi:cell division protein FtsB
VPRLRPTRLLAIGGLAVLIFLYWKPTQTYFHTRQQLDIRRTDVQRLRDERSQLEKRIALAGTSEQLVREARRLGLVKPGERLFIVKGISAWRKHR